MFGVTVTGGLVGLSVECPVIRVQRGDNRHALAGSEEHCEVAVLRLSSRSRFLDRYEIDGVLGDVRAHSVKALTASDVVGLVERERPGERLVLAVRPLASEHRRDAWLRDTTADAILVIGDQDTAVVGLELGVVLRDCVKRCT